MAEHVVLVVGAMGAGKTTAINSLSDIETIKTETKNLEKDVVNKATTTVALDYGEISLTDSDKLRLYGVPGQKRFDFMWNILKKKAVGLLVLVKNDNPYPGDELLQFVEEFKEIHDRGGMVIGVTHTDLAPIPTMDDYQELLDAHYPEYLAPVFTVDPRDRDSLITMLMALAANVEARKLFTGGS